MTTFDIKFLAVTGILAIIAIVAVLIPRLMSDAGPDLPEGWTYVPANSVVFEDGSWIETDGDTGCLPNRECNY